MFLCVSLRKVKSTHTRASELYCNLDNSIGSFGMSASNISTKSNLAVCILLCVLACRDGSNACSYIVHVAVLTSIQRIETVKSYTAR